MSANPNILIKDSCILFDLLDLELLAEFYGMPFTVVTTENVVAEVTDGDQRSLIEEFIATGRLQVNKDADFMDVIAIKQQHSGLSIADCSVLELGLRLQGIILSADGTLRNTSAARGLEVRGGIWVIAQLVEHELLTKERACEKLEKYKTINKRVPVVEIDRLIGALNA